MSANFNFILVRYHATSAAQTGLYPHTYVHLVVSVSLSDGFIPTYVCAFGCVSQSIRQVYTHIRMCVWLASLIQEGKVWGIITLKWSKFPGKVVPLIQLCPDGAPTVLLIITLAGINAS